MRLIDLVPLVIALPMLLLCYDALPYYLDVKPDVGALKTLSLIMIACVGALMAYVLYLLEIVSNACRMSLERHSGRRTGATEPMVHSYHSRKYAYTAPNMSLWSTAKGPLSDGPYVFGGQGIYAEASSRGTPVPIVEAQFTDVMEDRMTSRKKSSNTKVTKYRKNRLGGGTDAGGMTEIENREPARPPNVASDFLTPMYQSLFSGFIGMLLGAFIGWKINNIVDCAIIGGIGGMAVVWFVQLGLARKLVWKIETITQHDWDGDGEEGEPDTTHPMVTNAGEARQKVSTKQADTNKLLNQAGLIAMLNRLYVVGTSESANGVNPGSAAWDTFNARRQILLDLGILTWKNPARHQSGTQLMVDQPTAVQIINEHVNDLPIV